MNDGVEDMRRACGAAPACSFASASAQSASSTPLEVVDRCCCWRRRPWRCRRRGDLRVVELEPINVGHALVDRERPTSRSVLVEAALRLADAVGAVDGALVRLRIEPPI